MGRFLIKRTPTGYKFDLKDPAGDVLATSEVYTTRAACVKGAQGVAAVAADAPCADLTRGETALNPKFEIFRDKAGHYRFRLKARNGKIIAVSEAHMTLYGAAQAVAAVRAHAPTAPLEG